MTTDRPQHAVLPALALLLLAVASYANALRGEFLYDDYPYIVENTQVQQPTARRLLLEPLSGRAELGLYRPLPTLSYAVQAGGNGAGAPTWPFHLLNVLLHAAVALLVWRFARALGAADGTAWLAGALFAVHPCHVEAVDWIVGRAELMAALFGLGFLLLGLRRAMLGAALLLLLAGLSKESAFALPGVLIVIELALGRIASLKAAVRRHWPWLLVLVALSLLRLAALSDFTPELKLRFGPAVGLAPYADLPWHERTLVALNLLGEYFRRALLPTPPRIFFHHAEFLGWQPWCITGVAAFGAALWLARRRPVPRAALLAFPIALATVLNLRPIQETFAERFLYLPSALVCIAIATALAWPVARERDRRGRVGLSLVLPAAAVAGLLGATWLWNPVFDDALSLWLHNARLAPDLPFVHYQAAYFQDLRGIYTPRDAETPGAIRDYELALALNDARVKRGEKAMPKDQYARAHLALGAIFHQQLPPARQDHRRALVELREAWNVARNWYELDPEAGRAALLIAHLRHFETGVTKEEARSLLEEASLRELKQDAELKQAIRADLELVKRELADGR